RSRTRPAATYVARASRGRIVVRNTRGKLVGRYGSRLRIQRAGHPVRLLGPALNGVRDGRYRGAIEMLVDGGGLTAINVLPIDPYVKGVVPGEMPASWPAEALKAQAVVARSYALATRKSGGAFDQYPDTRSQVYRGVNGESPMSSAAVDATAGQILAYGGRPAVTYYFSTSGGHTESVENVFIGSLSRPWLVGVPDPYDDLSPHHRWRARFSTAGMTRALRGHVRGSFRKIKVLRRGRSPRIVRARIYGTRGTSEISGPALRSELGLRDTWAYFSRVSSKATRTRAAQALHALVPVRPSPWRAKPRSTDLSGSFEPAPRGRRILIERRVGHSWRLTGRVRTSRAGRYRASVARAGVYRVRAGSVAGPSVRVR
ncbi:MAG TPA: SpoIID/LytB domain-containing protein, partial [Thermoleophilaceae bacterium]|nr:SpoIID/LytB domain-containing protein [Thermoleophilaceae bacterium]